MVKGRKIDRPAAVIFMLLLVLSISGVLAYYVWISRPSPPPARSRPVSGAVSKSIDDEGGESLQGFAPERESGR